MRNRTMSAVVAGAILITMPLSTASAQAVRQIVSSSPAMGAPGYMLDLYRVTIPKGTTLPLHYHPGTQVSQVQRGDLTYTVQRGVAYLTIPRPGADPRRIRIRAGQTRVVHAGQGLIEQAGMRHVASTPKNTVVVVLSILRPKNAPGTINVAP